MHLDLSADEAAVLVDVLDTSLSELREEIYKSEVAEYKASLKQREALLASVRSRLGAPQPAS
jgi:recombinational DNA repair ATPase RecF